MESEQLKFLASVSQTIDNNIIVIKKSHIETGRQESIIRLHKEISEKIAACKKLIASLKKKNVSNSPDEDIDIAIKLNEIEELYDKIRGSSFNALIYEIW